MNSEQRAACEQMEAAIRAYTAAWPEVYQSTTKHGVLVDWVVVGAWMNPPDDEERARTAHAYLYSEGDLPTYRSLGLIHLALSDLKLKFSVGREDFE
jgi:hypothetical protein